MAFHSLIDDLKRKKHTTTWNSKHSPFYKIIVNKVDMAKASNPATSLKKKPKLSGSEQVVEFISKLDPPLKKDLEAVREIILSANREITEHIKWNGPSFCFKGEDRVTFNLHNKAYLLLVFHRGAKVKEIKGNGPLYKDATGLLEWVANDRAIVKLNNAEEIKTKKDRLKKAVAQWIKFTSE